MKKRLLFTLLATYFSSIIFGQVIDELPTDENGKINFNEVVVIDSVSAGEIYLRAKRFFVDTFKSANDVIQMDDKEASIIIGKGYSDIYIKIAGPPTALQLWYSIKIQGRDGRYRFDIYDISFKSYSSQYAPSSEAPAEQAFEKSTYYKKNGEPRAVSERYKIEMTKVIEDIINSIKTEMKVPIIVKSKNDW